ncbi:IPT/TIG domain-containing protein [Streptomyces sp. NPDC101166]|uniref:IPT/TIG domain-containing protein n=1 Tax=Streptomyces sp. NPDC101166 TaxID=3366120 RepID=UPI003819EB7E
MAAPVVSSVSPNQGPAAGGTTVTVTGTGFTGATAVRFGTKLATSFTVNSSTQITAVAPSGSGSVVVTVTTNQGTSAQQVPFTYTATPAPSLSGISPGQGLPAGGTTVTLTGTNLTGATAVKFDGVAATSYTVNSSTQITAVTPAHAAGAAAVTVTTPSGTSNALTFTYLAAAPSVTGLSPGQGPASGGTTVTLTGTNLTGATEVRFDDVAATSFTVNSSTQITAVTPAHVAGAAAVTVTTPGGTSNPDNPSAYFFFAATPSLTAVNPGAGPTTGGTTVTLTGSDLLGATAVKFDGVAATSYTVDSSTQITAVTPAHAAGTAAVTVTTPGGTSNSLVYSYLAAPTLSSLVPTQGPTHAGAVITLTGANLTTTTSVRFGVTPVSFTVVSPTQITAVAPAGPSGPVTVTVVTPAGTSNGLIYARTDAPVI